MNIKIWEHSKESVPTIYIHSFIGNGQEIWEACQTPEFPAFNLVSIQDFDFESDLCPWAANVFGAKHPPFKGGGKRHLEKIVNEIIPYVESQLPAPSQYQSMVGYSLAGLFTFWTLSQSPVFKRIGCVSASFWYPDFLNKMRKELVPLFKPDCIYISLGNKEHKTNHALMKTIDTCTADIVSCVQEMGIPNQYEINYGNHFDHQVERMVKAIKWLLKQ